MVIPSSNTYQVLRYATPMFLQMVYSNPKLWPEGCDPTVVPLANTMVSHPYVFSHFILLDAMTAMAFGLPQQVEYSSTVDSLPTNFTSYAHCSPLDFQITLVEINACRDKSPNARNWEEIEYKLKNW